MSLKKQPSHITLNSAFHMLASSVGDISKAMSDFQQPNTAGSPVM